MPQQGLGPKFVPNVVADVAKFDLPRGRPTNSLICTRQEVRFGSALFKPLFSGGQRVCRALASVPATASRVLEFFSGIF